MPQFIQTPIKQTSEQCQDDQCCPLPAGDRLYQHYHDEEWGQPTDSDRVFFEKVCLEGFQSGLSWRTVLHRRESLREAFDHFDTLRVASYKERDIQRLLDNPAIIRNRRKIRSAINNAQRAIDLRSEFGSLAAFFWQFEPQDNSRPERVTLDWLKANPKTAESIRLANALKSRGWTFVGPVNMYALMQALGIVNDHVEHCFRQKAVERLRNQFARPACT